MNETPTPAVQTEKTGLDEKKKNALLRYIAVMFAVAFVFVLLSLIGQMRNSEATISQLSQSSTSALTKAEQLQDDNRALLESNAFLSGRIEELEKQQADLEKDLASLEQQLSDQDGYKRELEQLQDELTQLQQEAAMTLQAYELLVQILADEEPDPALLKQLEEYQIYLAEHGRTTYENRSKEGE